MKHEDKIYIDKSSNEVALQQALLERKISEEEICMVEQQGASQIIFDIQEIVNLTEIEHCLLLPKITAPRIDGITPKIIHTCWNIYKSVTLPLYQ